MLNITSNTIVDKIDRESFSSLRLVEEKNTKRLGIRMIKWSVFLIFVILLLPWTQNIRSNGAVTTLKPNQRPQDIHSVIAGRIEQWNVQEGDYVNLGDTIVIISEVKDDYFDEKLLDRTSDQLDFKKQIINSYGNKINAQEDQLSSLIQLRNLKLEQIEIKILQTKLKVQNDSISFIAAKLDKEIADYQLERMDSLHRLGYKALTDLEKTRINAQQANAKKIAAKNNWSQNRNELISLKIEKSNTQSEFDKDYSKTNSDKFSTETEKYDTETDIVKMKNQLRNYQVRQGFYIITAPQNGYVTKLLVQGLGETIKEGQPIVSFMPGATDLAVEIYVNPIDLPLLEVGRHVRLQFDGWPAIIFSGWPGVSYGTYGGEVYAIDQFISPNGKYRVLVKPEKKGHKWPKVLRVGGGTKSMILLENVPIWYELWRKINGFPPNFYIPLENEK
ncbi:MAG: HlyD family efflux transporter periplasmic adaptor subunit [Crocinitomicaceae bacterium]